MRKRRASCGDASPRPGTGRRGATPRLGEHLWRLLATGSGERDGAEALRWARHLTRNVDYDQWSLIDTLAAAYAEVGQFDDAIEQMQKVLARAQADGDVNGAEVARRRLVLYQAREPLREQDEPAPFKP